MNNSTAHHDEKIAKLTFASVYPHYVNKVVNKGRSEVELRAIISWLTGYPNEKIDEAIKENYTFSEFFENANVTPNAEKITGLICGYRVEEIQNPLTQKVRYLDKIVDELAKGKSVEKICRI